MQSVHQDQILKKKISQASYLTLLLLLSKRCPAKALKTAIKASLEKSYSKMSLTVELRWQQCLLIPGCKRIGFHYPANISKHRSHDDTRHSFGPKTRWNWLVLMIQIHTNSVRTMSLPESFGSGKICSCSIYYVWKIVMLNLYCWDLYYEAGFVVSEVTSGLTLGFQWYNAGSLLVTSSWELAPKQVMSQITDQKV